MNRITRRKLGYGSPHLLPIDLGIKQYKRDHPGESKRIAFYKERMWKANNELRS